MIPLTALEAGYCVLVLVASYALRGSTGFGGFAAMPLLALVIPMKLLVPVWTLLTITSSATLFGKDRRHVSLRHILGILPACVLGIALGLYLFKVLDQVWLARGLGALVSGYGLYALWQTRSAAPLNPPRGVATAASFLAGAVGTIFGTMASIFFAIHLDAIRITKEQFRGTLSAMMMTLAVIRGAGYFAVGEFGRESLLLFAAALPFMLLGIYLGDRVHTGMSDATFRRVICAILILSGLPLMLK
ncbi:MAG: sulfite exporter TauE/SafE family protein [Betaproteobacteria bacterium]|jgi:uncharacterized membrane protein YfcA|nr:sulfite exporter TauE/SafE family protein [Betaproteobacteria bacterium]MDH4292938.1 sulfite exporter TauE/SafE family protein [Betaproteobacteria bacterium]